jgi:hypothetical protein
MDDFDLALNPAIPATYLIVDASGEMNCVCDRGRPPDKEPEY